MSITKITDTLQGKELKLAHLMLQARLPWVDRFSMVSYDPMTDLVSSCISSAAEGASLNRHQAPLARLPMLKELSVTGKCRIVDDATVITGSPGSEADLLEARSFRSSFTQPIYRVQQLAGFVFMDSLQPGAFRAQDEALLIQLGNAVAHLLLLKDAFPNGLTDALPSAMVLAQIPGVESHNHLRRMALYSRLIAEAVAQDNELDDEFVECVYRFAPLHDIGMAAIPGSLLRKAGRLDEAELSRIKKHPQMGALVMEHIAAQTGSASPQALRVMRNIVLSHHERGDGSGYPNGLRLEETPLEARIVAVADVYDALSTKRSYRDALPEQSIEHELLAESGRSRLDRACVAALLAARAQCREIKRQFPDTEEVLVQHAPAI